MQSLVISVLSLALLTCATASSRAAQTAPVASTQEGALPYAPQPLAAAGSAPTVLSAAQLARDAALAPRTLALLEAFTNGRPRLLSDGRVVFVSNRDGLPAIYVGDAAQPSASPRKLPGPDERIAGYEVLPDQKTVLFAADVKSDQLFAIFKVGLDGTGLANLTPDEALSRSVPLVARGIPDLFAYTAHTLDDAASRVMIQRTGGTPREIWRAPGTGDLQDFTQDGGRLLFLRVDSDDKMVLLQIDVAKGVAKRVYPAQGMAKLTSAAYTADGRGIYVAQERAGKPGRLILLDAATLKERARFDERSIPTAAPDIASVSPRGDRIVVRLDAGNRVEVRIHDARTLALLGKVQAGGAASGGAFRADGDRFALSVAGTEGPADIVSVDAQTLKLTPLRAEERPGLGPETRPSARIVEIPAFDGKPLPLNVYLPPSATGPSPKKHPSLVLVHGGPSGSAYLRWSATVAFWTSMGFAVIEPNIRGSTGFGSAWQSGDDKEKRIDAMKDMATINAWIRAQPWCDGSRIVVGGISYGGYMALLALTRQPTLWAAGIDGSGMSDLRTMEKNEDQTVRVFDEEEFGTLGKDDAVLLEWSPLKDVAKVVAPLFVYQGVHDPVTPQGEADQIVTALRAHGVPVEYMLLENEGHGVSRRENIVSYLNRSYRFLAEQLRLD
jgi:dipeptidyl aminopeptidase/acylaminoacyl peptidase